MTPTTRIRLLWGILALLIILVGLAFASPHLINSKVVKQQISRQISDWTGLPVTVRGEPVITVFPYLTVKLKDVQVASNLGNEQPPLVAMDNLRAEMYWMPLLVGKFKVRRFNLVRPRFHLERRKDGSRSWNFEEGNLFASGKAGKSSLGNISLGRFMIASGQVRYIDARKGQDEKVSDANLSMLWPNTGRAADVTGQFVWRGEPISIAAHSQKPMELINGGLSPLSLEAISTRFEASIEGTAATVADLQMEGEFAFKSQSMRYLLEWLGYPVKPGASFGAIEMTARANMVGASAALADLSLSLDDNKADGALQLDFRRDRTLIQGTLAYDQLDLRPYMERMEGEPSLLDQAFSPQDLGRMDIDVRLSAQQLQLGPLKLGRTAASLVTRNGQVALSIGEAFAYGGRLEANLDMHPSKRDPECLASHLRAKISGGLAGTFAREMERVPYVNGTTLAELDIAGEGKNLRDTLLNASGELSVVITDGSVNRFNLVNLMDTLESGEAGEPDALFEGGTDFDVLSVSGSMGNKKVVIDGLRMTAGNLDMAGSAQISLENGELDFPGLLARYRSSDPATHSAEDPVLKLPFYLAGPVSLPYLAQLPDEKEPSGKQPDIPVPGVPQGADIPKATPAQEVKEPEKQVKPETRQESISEKQQPAPNERQDKEQAPASNPASPSEAKHETTPKAERPEKATPQDLIAPTKPQETIIKQLGQAAQDALSGSGGKAGEKGGLMAPNLILTEPSN